VVRKLRGMIAAGDAAGFVQAAAEQAKVNLAATVAAIMATDTTDARRDLSAVLSTVLRSPRRLSAPPWRTCAGTHENYRALATICSEAIRSAARYRSIRPKVIASPSLCVPSVK
jgi:hypothetical protein